MQALQIEDYRRNIATTVKKITGFSTKELSELNSMDYREMKECVLNTLDRRNNGIGSVWHNGYMVFTAWIRDGAVFLEVGNNCD